MALLTKEEQELYEKVCAQVKLIMDTEKVGGVELVITSGVSWPTIYRARKAKGGFTMYNLMKILTALGYEIAFTKIKQPAKAAKDPANMQKLINIRKYNEDAKRKGRNQPIRKGTRIVKKPIGNLVTLGQRNKIEG